jgi:hypothetical protein
LSLEDFIAETLVQEEKQENNEWDAEWRVKSTEYRVQSEEYN